MTEIKQNELESLKLFCDNAGISYHASIGLEKLREKVEKFHAAVEEKEIAKAVENEGANEREKIRKEALKLVRIRLTCMDPNKRDHTSEIFSAGNSILGSVTRVIPFGVDWHCEQILLNMIQEKVFRQSYEVPDGRGGKIRKNRFVPSYSVAILPKLTLDELKDLAQQQAARGSIDEE